MRLEASRAHAAVENGIADQMHQQQVKTEVTSQCVCLLRPLQDLSQRLFAWDSCTVLCNAQQLVDEHGPASIGTRESHQVLATVTPAQHCQPPVYLLHPQQGFRFESRQLWLVLFGVGRRRLCLIERCAADVCFGLGLDFGFAFHLCFVWTLEIGPRFHLQFAVLLLDGLLMVCLYACARCRLSEWIAVTRLVRTVA